jgi:hypothetical protein
MILDRDELDMKLPDKMVVTLYGEGKVRPLSVESDGPPDGKVERLIPSPGNECTSREVVQWYVSRDL